MKVIRTLLRIYVDDLDKQVSFYQQLFGGEVKDNRADQGGETAIEVGSFLLIGGTDKAPRFGSRASVNVVVDSLEDFVPLLEQQGASIIRGIQPIPCGKNMIVRHPEGTILEYEERSTVG